ncbi:acyltransferase [Microbacterium oxydans]|nr:acyltransferase [Microbacterium oxydans]
MLLTPRGVPSHRADIDGLRALAILLVVVYHVWLGRVSGGVDVFLMVSAFFLTGSFARRMQEGRPLQLGSFWIRRFLRLVPAAAVTIAGVLAVAFVAFPRTEWPRVWSEAWSSLFYVENWTLAFSEVDYYARSSQTPSVFQHFWSLSVQGQVFLLWPLLFAGVWLALRTRRHLIVPALFAVFGTIFVVSLVFSIMETNSAQDFAYFDTRTRLWEFAAGFSGRLGAARSTWSDPRRSNARLDRCARDRRLRHRHRRAGRVPRLSRAVADPLRSARDHRRSGRGSRRTDGVPRIASSPVRVARRLRALPGPLARSGDLDGLLRSIRTGDAGGLRHHRALLRPREAALPVSSSSLSGRRRRSKGRRSSGSGCSSRPCWSSRYRSARGRAPSCSAPTRSRRVTPRGTRARPRSIRPSISRASTCR